MAVSRITIKEVQIHNKCICGWNEVYQEKLQVKWKDISVLGIKRKKDKKTGKIFLLDYTFLGKCPGHHFYQ